METPETPETLEVAEIAEIAAALLDARASGKPIRRFAQSCAEITVRQAYDVQAEQVRARTGAGETVRGFRIAGASPAARRTTEPVFGHVFAADCDPGHRPAPSGGMIAPRAEPGIAFVLGATLAGPGITVPDAARAVEFVLPALEITDSRIAATPESALSEAELAADNAGAGFVVFGQPHRWPATDLALTGCVLYRGGEVGATGAGGMALGSPPAALAWLANAAGAQGIVLRPGQFVLSGAFTPPLPVEAGDTVMASFAGLGRVVTRLAP